MKKAVEERIEFYEWCVADIKNDLNKEIKLENINMNNVKKLNDMLEWYGEELEYYKRVLQDIKAFDRGLF